MFDVTKLSESFEDIEQMEITHPVTGLPMDAFLHIRNPDSPKARQDELAIRGANVRRIQKNASANTLEQIDATETRILVSRIVGWEGIEDNGTPLAYNKENAAYLLDKFPWLREQAATFANERSNFFTQRQSN